jgi:N-acetylmuramoyl-L-alanine amidase-like protein
MRPLLAAAAVALAAPGAAAGAGLSLASHDLAPATRAPLRLERFDLVGLHWRGSGSVTFRTRSRAGRWSGWHTAAAEDDDLPDHGTEGRSGRDWRIGNPFWTGGAEAIQYRTHGRVTQVRGFFVRSPNVAPRFRLPMTATAPDIITRGDWSADESIVRGAPRYADSVHLALVHHTAGSNSYAKSRSASIVRAIELYHVKGNGWNDIGYNFLVDRYGQVFEGRRGGIARAVIGAHAQGFNTGSVGVAVIGSFGSGGITAPARSALARLLAWRLDIDHVDPLSSVVRVSSGNPRYRAGTPVTMKAIGGHRDAYPTSCPGAGLYAQLPGIRVAVAQTGLPKLYSPRVVGTLGGPVRFAARLSEETAWTVTVRDQDREVVASGTGIGTSVDWTWDAIAVPPARYTWTISAPQLRAAVGTIGTAPAPLALQQLRVVPAVVTPNGDGRGDKAKITYRLTARAMVTAIAQDVFGTTVATLFSGSRAAGAQTFVWTASGVPDGWYRLTLTAKDAIGRRVQSTTRFWVNRTLADFGATEKAISPNDDGRLDGLDFSFRLIAAAHVSLRILRGSTVAAALLDADLGAGPQRLSWDGSGLADGRYSAVVSATDTLLTVAQSLPVRLDRAPPVLRLLSFRQLTFRVSEPGRLVLAVNGRWRSARVKRAGLMRIGHRGRVRGLTAFLVDEAGNRSRTIRVP